jgi:uracil-DNA glycosylase family 4
MSERLDQMNALWNEVHACQRCALGGLAQHKVFGDGNVWSRIMIVGEGPGADEDKTGHPFVGMAGQILTTSLYDAGLDRRRLFIANALKCHPPIDPQTRSGNRKPTVEEIVVCSPFLFRQIRILRPKIIVALGGSSLGALISLPLNTRITPLIGTALPFVMDGWQTTIVVTFHPSYIGYNSGDHALRDRYVDIFRMIKNWASQS